MKQRSRKLPYKPRLDRESRRHVILDAAEQLFSQRGFDAPSLADLAAASDITKPTLAEHFAGKHELYLAVLDRQGRALVDYMAERVTDQQRQPRDRLRAVLDAFFGWIEEHPTAWRMLFRELPPETSAASGARRIHDQAAANVLASISDVEPRVRHLPDDQQLMLAEAFKGAQQSLAQWWYEHPDVERAEVVDLVTGVIWNALRGTLDEVNPRPTRRRRRG